MTRNLLSGSLLSWNLLSDDEFVAQVEACSYPIEKFRHLDHVRLAWIYLQRYSYQEAESRMQASIASASPHTMVPSANITPLLPSPGCDC